MLQSDGGNYSACVNAATLALIDAGIAMRDVVCSCTAAVLGTDVNVVDVNNVEDSSSRGAVISVAVLPKSDQIVHVEMAGRLHEDRLPALLETASKGCHEVVHLLDDVIRHHVTKLASTVGKI